MNIRQETPADLAAIRQVNRSAFARHARSLAATFSGEGWMAIELAPGVLTRISGRVQYTAPFLAFGEASG